MLEQAYCVKDVLSLLYQAAKESGKSQEFQLPSTTCMFCAMLLDMCLKGHLRDGN